MGSVYNFSKILSMSLSPSTTPLLKMYSFKYITNAMKCSMKVIFDSSTLILLAKIDLLRTAADKFDCVITEEVKEESTRKTGSFDAKMISELIKEDKIKIEKTERRKNLEYEFNLGEGEASVLSLAHSKKAIIATDDRLTINACKILSIKFVTAIDFVIRSFEKGEIGGEEAKLKIGKLDEYGRYDRKIIESGLKKIGDKK